VPRVETMCECTPSNWSGRTSYPVSSRTLELAAARTRVLPPAAMLKRLEHRLTFLTGGGPDLARAAANDAGGNRVESRASE
jgi:hypothetical protein